MRKNKDKIDMLIEKNAAEQFSQIDWGRLNAAISGRLDKARQKASFSIDFPTLLKITATIAAAAVVLVTVTLNIEKLTDIKQDSGRTAEVQLVDSKGSASVEIQTASAGSQVTVDIGTKRTLAKCDVEILDKNGGFKENTIGPTWIIISRPQSLYAENGTDRDMMDMMCLF